jgi:integrase
VLAGNIIDMGNDKYRLRVSNGFDLNGKRKYYNKTVSCVSKREAEKELARFITSIEGSCTYSASKTTLNEYSQMWLQTYVMPNLSPTTYQSYNEKLNKHILPYLGSKRLDKIKPLDLDNLYNFLLTKPTNKKDNLGNFKTLSPASVHRVHEILSSIFNNALRWDLVPYNPCTKVVQPKYRRTKMSCYDEETSKRLINTLLAKAPIKYKCFVILAILTGFRRGEIVGLHWDDIDFKNHKITVNRSAYYLSGQPTSEKGPKTDTSNRTIVVPKLCFDLLKQWRAEQG